MNKFLTLVCVCIGIAAHAQDIPVGTWRYHLSYNRIHSLAASATRLYGATTNGIVVVNQSDGSLDVINKVNGLSSTGITSIAFDLTTQQLIVSYDDGLIDLVNTNGTTVINQLKTSPTIAGSRRINHIAIHSGLAYLATDFGVAVIDLERQTVKETFRDLGSTGSTLKILSSTFKGDSIFLATQTGVIAGDLNDNLLDFNQWKRFDTGVFTSPVVSVTTSGSKVYAASNGNGIYEYAAGTWVLKYLAGNSFFKVVPAADGILICANTGLFHADDGGSLAPIEDASLTFPLTALEAGGVRWIGDSKNGLIRQAGSSFTAALPNGVSFEGGQSLYYNAASDNMLATSGGYSGSYLPRLNTYALNAFSDGSWQQVSSLLNLDLTDVVVRAGNTYLASFGYGLQVTDDAGSSTLYNQFNSPLQNVAPGNNVRVSALASGTDGVWVANYGATNSLHLLKPDGTWESFSFPIAGYQNITDLAVDIFGNVWMVLNPATGGGIIVFKRSTGDYAYLSEIANVGGLPSRSVYSIAMDRDGQVWVGTAQGVAYFANPADAFRTPVNAVRPIFGTRALLRDDKVTTITVDGGNRKWIGTERGVWLFDPFGEKQIHNFTQDNSPLLSNVCVDIAIQESTGEVFMLTDRGIQSFRADATPGKAVFTAVKIFPNPVTAAFNGLVGITGLTTDATVKITDVSGKLVWQTKANGGMASWNVRDYTGNRAATGIYLVFAINQDGTESMVGKIAIVN